VVEALLGWLSGDWTKFWASVTACPPIGGYGVRLIRLWIGQMGRLNPYVFAAYLDELSDQLS